MRQQVKQLTEECEWCLLYKRAHPKDPPVEPEVDVEDLDPMESLGMDIFFYQGVYYLVVTDLAIRYTFVENLGKSTTCKEVTERCRRLFKSFGYPGWIRYNGGPHFRAEFKEMLKEYNIPETPSSPYNHPLNGLAERHVGVAKLLLKKV